MARYRVMVEGGPVYLRDVATQEIKRLGFFTTRWVEADTKKMAGEKAWQDVMAELAATGTCNPSDNPVKNIATESVELSWFEGFLRRDGGQGFTFYPEGANEAV